MIPRWSWPDARGYIGLGTWLLTVFIFILIWLDRDLLDSDAFLILATAVVINGWGQAVGWAYGSNKTSGELAEKNANIVERQAAFSNEAPGEPEKVTVMNDESDPVPTRPAGAP